LHENQNPSGRSKQRRTPRSDNSHKKSPGESITWAFFVRVVASRRPPLL